VKIKMSEIIFIVEDADEGGYTAQALGYSIHTEGETLDELKASIKDAVKCHFDAKERPRIVRLHMVKDELMAI
jgi:predicted RNase H-like HicB family nuclease